MKATLLSSAAALILLVLSLQTTSTLACSCGGPVTIQSTITRSETAVWASIREVLPPPADQSGSQYYRANADGVVKGCGLIRDKEFYIKTAANSALCGVDLQAGGLYILFGSVTNESIVGRGTSAVLTIYLCSANTAFTNVDRPTLTFLVHQPVPVCNNNGNNAPVPAPAPVPIPVRPGSLGTVNCQVCPAGFYDGCNTCSCSNGVRTFCSNRVCSTHEREFCSNLRPNPRPPTPSPRSPPTPNPVAPWWSTNRSPPTLPPVNRPQPDNRPNNRAISCRSCPRGFYDGCNSCSCSTGRAVCTERTCTWFGQASCSNFDRPPPPISSNPNNDNPLISSTELADGVLNCQTCPNGYYDGCNTCGCGSGGKLFCTTNQCQMRGTPRCNM